MEGTREFDTSSKRSYQLVICTVHNRSEKNEYFYKLGIFKRLLQQALKSIRVYESSFKHYANLWFHFPYYFF
jgi:hypothetical protein